MTDIRHPTTSEQDNWAAVRRQFWGDDKRPAHPAVEQPAVIAGVDLARGPDKTVAAVYDVASRRWVRRPSVWATPGFWQCDKCRWTFFWTLAQHLDHQAGCDGQ